MVEITNMNNGSKILVSLKYFLENKTILSEDSVYKILK